MNLTGQQQAAVTTEGRALLVDAGAGTGKTAVLVQRFLHLLEQHPDWPVESIVAVTFAEKATREMRSRIRAGVEARAAEAGPFSPWQDRRRELDRIAVSTIHGMCARILRENPIATGIDPRFTVLEEQDTMLLREQAVRQALADLASGVQPAGAEAHDPFDLLAEFETQDLEEQMMRLLGQRGTVGRLFDRLPETEQLLAEWRQGVAEMQREVWAAQLASDGCAQEALTELPALLVANRADRLVEYVRLAQEGCAHAAARDLCAAAGCFARIKVNVGSQAAWGGKDGLEEVKGWLKSLRALGAALTGHGCDRRVGEEDERAAEALQSWRVLWNYASEIYDGLKQEARALDFDDLERLAHRLLTAEPRDERVQATIDGINQLMVDEFQDVNEVQGEILAALAGWSKAGRFFAVGDAKQSIYRFRQAQVKVFNRVAREIYEETGHAALPLNHSYRTHPALLAALNEAFDRVFKPEGKDHTDFEARPGRLDAERVPLDPCDVAPACVEIIALPEAPADATRRAEAAVLARRLHELVAGGLQVWDRRSGLRPVRYGDMAILFRATTSLPIYEEMFKQEGLPYVTISGRGYYDRPEVRDLTALLACLHNPADDLSLATVLRSPMFSLSDETLYRLRWFGPDCKASSGPIPFARAMGGALASVPQCAQPAEVLHAARTLTALQAATGRIDVCALIRMALDLTGYEATLALADAQATTRTAAGGGRGRANVVKFLQLARDRGGANLSAFLQSVEDLRTREVREGEALSDSPDSGAVQLMSVHAAKGLEFPVVVLADLGRAPRAGQTPRILHDPMFGLACQVRDANGDWTQPVSYSRAAWLDGRMEQAESKRLLYVACTRAADLLILSGGVKVQDSWLTTMAAAWDLSLENGASPCGPSPAAILEARDGYNVRVVWPAAVEEEESRLTAERRAPGEPAPVLDAVPPLARPLPTRRAAWPVAVTHLGADLEDETYIPPLRPIVDWTGDGAARGVPWHFLVGNLAHRALADWECLALQQGRLEEKLAGWARRGGLLGSADIRAAVARVSRMLDGLRGTGLYREIATAQERYAEVPLSICAGERVLHGVLDLLYRDRHGEWHLLDWKTEPVVKGRALQEAAAGSTLRQVAIYQAAVQQTLGLAARVEICFLSQRAEVYCPPDDELAREWEVLLSEPQGAVL